MRKVLLLVLIAAFAALTASVGIARADAPVDAQISASGGSCCQNRVVKDGYPKVTDTHRIVRSSYEFTANVDVTVGVETTSFTCDGQTPDELVHVDLVTREYRITNFEIWDCASDGGEAGSLRLRNVGAGAFGVGWAGTYTILQGTGFFDGATGSFTSGTAGVGGTIKLRP